MACSAGVQNSRAMGSKSQFGSMRSTSMPTSRPQAIAMSASLPEWEIRVDQLWLAVGRMVEFQLLGRFIGREAAFGFRDFVQGQIQFESSDIHGIVGRVQATVPSVRSRVKPNQDGFRVTHRSTLSAGTRAVVRRPTRRVHECKSGDSPGPHTCRYRLARIGNSLVRDRDRIPRD
jgi:hypothetical protein